MYINRTKLAKPLSVEIENSDKIKITKSIMTTFSLNSMPGVKLTTILFIIPGNLKVILLEEPFLAHEEVMIDYKKAWRRIANYNICFDDRIQEWEDNPDSLLVEKALTISIEFIENRRKNILKELDHVSHTPS